MVLLTDGGKVGVVVNNKRCREYALEEKVQGDTTTYTCYIHAKIGNEYKVHIKNIPIVWQGRLTGQLSIDGVHTADFSECAPRYKAQWEGHTMNRTFRGYQATNNEGSRVVRCFTFGKIKSNEAVDRPVQPSNPRRTELAKLCTFRIEMVQTVRTGMRLHKKAISSPRRIAVPVDSVPDDSKPSEFEIITRAGREVPDKDDDDPQTCHCNFDEDGPHRKTIIVFRYLSHKGLVKRGLKVARAPKTIPIDEQDSSDEEVVFVSQTDGKRCKDQMKEEDRNVRVKS